MKLEHAARQALKCLEDVFGKGKVDVGAITSLREALDHSGEANERVLTGLKITNKHGKLEFDPVYHEPAKRPQNCGTGYCSCIECPYEAEQADQEPVAWAHPSGGHLSARYMKEFATGLEKETHTIPLYAAPVRTKDLTDEEMLTEAVEAGFMLHTGYGQGANKMMPVSDSATLVEFARAVIAADREKNK